jgi:hypothetical protein
MRVEIIIIAITAFFIFNTYHDGKYSKLIMSYKKYYQMAFIGFLGICFYLLLKRNPANCKSMLANANNVIKYMPIDRSSLDMLSPIIDFTGSSGDEDGQPGSFITNIMGSAMGSANLKQQASSEQRILQSGGGGYGQKVKRSVSETKKKYVASMQDWKCGHCKQKLNAWFEVDHIASLGSGLGNNEVGNLVALCRECHGKKTAMENM